MMKYLLLILLFFCNLCQAAESRVVPDNIKAIIEKSESFGLGKYPIGFWNYCNLAEHGKYFTENEVKAWADAGFTLPMSPRYDYKDPKQKEQILHLLDWCQANGMKMIINDRRALAMPANKKNPTKLRENFDKEFKAATEDFGIHPASMGFMVWDEPNASIKDVTFACSLTQKKIKHQLHPFTNLLPLLPGILKAAGAKSWPEYLDEFVKKANPDMLCYDCYTQMYPKDSGWNDYFNNLRLYREAMLRNGVPFWTTLLCVGHFGYRCPTQDDIRWQFNTAIASGAHGILWFFYYQREQEANYRMAPMDEHFDRTETYYDIRRVQKSFNRRYGDLFTKLVCTKVMFWPKEYGGGQKFTPDHLVADVSGQAVIVSKFVDIKGHRYVMIVNNNPFDSGRVKVTFRGSDVRIFSLNWYGKEVEGRAYNSIGISKTDKGLMVDHYMAPGAEALYRVESKIASEEPILLKIPQKQNDKSK